MHTPKDSSKTQYLKPLSLCPKEKNQSDPPPPPTPPLDSSWTMYSPSSSSLIGHCIGVESCVDYRNDEEIRTSMAATADDESQKDQRLEAKKKKKNDRRRITKGEFPPPIPWLARTGNLPSHMPWVFKRYYTGDGRLVIREEKVRHHEYFRAHRSNGRLTLHLVPLNDDGLDLDQVADDDEDYEDGDDRIGEDADYNSDVEEEEEEDDDNAACNARDGDDDDGDDRAVAVEAPVENGRKGEGGGGKRGGKCIEYKSMRSSTCCIFGMEVPPFRPVHI